MNVASYGIMPIVIMESVVKASVGAPFLPFHRKLSSWNLFSLQKTNNQKSMVQNIFVINVLTLRYKLYRFIGANINIKSCETVQITRRVSMSAQKIIFRIC
jgi:hypothetical protein